MLRLIKLARFTLVTLAGHAAIMIENDQSESGSRPPVSCLPCRARKVRCDRQKHCGNCKRRGEDCTWPLSSLPQWATEGSLNEESLVADVDELKSRVSVLEQLVRSYHLNTSRPSETRDKQTLPRAPPVHQSHAQEQHGHPPQWNSGFGTGNAYDPSSTEIAISSSVQDHDMFDQQIITKKRKADAVDDGEVMEKDIQSFGGLVTFLPDKSTCDHLVSVYFERVEWIHHVVHRPMFKSWYNRVIQEPYSSIKGGHKNCIHLSLLYAMLCLSIYFDITITRERYQKAQRYFRLSCRALEVGEYLDHPNFVTIQTLIMQGLWLNDHGKGIRHHHNLAIAIRMANLLGMASQDGPTAKRSGIISGTSAQDQDNNIEIQKELNRRVYWSLICQDYYTASSCKFTYLIQPAQVEIQRPRNIEDEDLYISRSTESTTHLGPTSMSYHIEKIPYAMTVGRYIDLCHSPHGIQYHDILSLEQETRRLHKRLPSYLQCNEQKLPTTPLQWQALLLDITLHNRIMRLHRSFMVRGYTDPTYQHSTDVTLSSAKKLLELVSQGRLGNFPGLRWWVIRIHVFTAGVACCLALYHQGYWSGSRRESEQNLEEYIRLTFSLLSDASDCSNSAQHAIETLNVMYRKARRVYTRNTSSMPINTTPQYPRHVGDDPASSPPTNASNAAEGPSPGIDWNALLLCANFVPYELDQTVLETIDEFAIGLPS